MLYKGVNNADRPPKDGPAEDGGLLASSLPQMATRMPDGPAKKPGGAGSKTNSKLMQLALSPEQIQKRTLNKQSKLF